MSALSAVLLIFGFPFSLLFFHVGQPGSTEVYWFTQYWTSDVVENLGQFLVRSVQHREMILN